MTAVYSGASYDRFVLGVSNRCFSGEDCGEFASQSSQNRRFEPILQIVQIRKSIKLRKIREERHNESLLLRS